MRAPAPAATTRDARRRRRRSRWPRCFAARRSGAADARSVEPAMTAAIEPAPPAARAREAALQMLYQAEIGRASAARRDRNLLAGARSR